MTDCRFPPGEQLDDLGATAAAAALGVSLPTIPKMLKLLQRQGLVEYTSYYGAVLTRQGRRIALGMVVLQQSLSPL